MGRGLNFEWGRKMTKKGSLGKKIHFKKLKSLASAWLLCHPAILAQQQTHLCLKKKQTNNNQGTWATIKVYKVLGERETQPKCTPQIGYLAKSKGNISWQSTRKSSSFWAESMPAPAGKSSQGWSWPIFTLPHPTTNSGFCHWQTTAVVRSSLQHV